MSEHNIFQMTSFSRSGETLLQRCLNGHPQIEVVHQIHEPDLKEDLELFHYLHKTKVTTIAHDHPKVAHRNLKPGSVLVLKNAVWTQTEPRKGFTLVRNPFSQ